MGIQPLAHGDITPLPSADSAAPSPPSVDIRVCGPR
jgi:hypothetical protein